MNSSLAGLPVLCDEICDELGCEMPRDSTDRRQLDRAGANGRPISRFRRISDPVRTALRCYAATPRRFNGATQTDLARDRIRVRRTRERSAVD